MHAFTVDLEDWYHGIPLSGNQKSKIEHRLLVGLEPLLQLLSTSNTTATFFILGEVAKKYPTILKVLKCLGHELACHGLTHDFVYNLTPAQFKRDTSYCVRLIEDIIGSPVYGYRAPYFSITEQSLWALEILSELGIQYDSSIMPVQSWRYGITNYGNQWRKLKYPSGSLWEIPITVRSWVGPSIPVSGGAYFRIYPYELTKRNIQWCESQSLNAVFYIHPWELDSTHPKIPFEWRAHITHYYNLSNTRKKLNQLLAEFKFASLSSILNQLIVKDTL